MERPAKNGDELRSRTRIRLALEAEVGVEATSEAWRETLNTAYEGSKWTERRESVVRNRARRARSLARR